MNRLTQSTKGRAHCITDKIGKVFLHQEFDPKTGNLKGIRISQPQKFEDTAVGSILDTIAATVTETLDEQNDRGGQG